MPIWEVSRDVVNFASMYLVDDLGEPLSFYTEWFEFKGQRIGEKWICFKAKFNEDKPVANFTDFDGVLICNTFALRKFEHSVLFDEVEILPLDLERFEIKVLNIIDIIDCLDEEKSEIKYFKDSKNIMRIIKYSFNTSLLENVMLFKIPQLSRTHIFATDTFRNRVLGSALTGLEFKLVY